MKRSEIIEEAKQFVLAKGPRNILEFGDEFLADARLGRGWTQDEMDAVLHEAVRQAERVYDFLGYVPCGGFTTR